MPQELILYITKYGYLTIFSLVFLQEIGVPNPVPNELVLLFSGYLAFTGVFSIAYLFGVVVAADFLGTALLYVIFYHFGEDFFARMPRWFPLKKEKLDRIRESINKKGWWGIYLGRLLPYVRGYTSVVAGLLRIRPKKFLFAVFFSAVTWSGGYVIVGRLLGKKWEDAAQKFGNINQVVVFFVLGLLLLYVTPKLYKKLRRKEVL